MKWRITLSVDPAVTRQAKKLAYAMRTSERSTSLAERWAGKFTVARTKRGDLRMRALKARYRLSAR